jgi:hypothetical protein
MKPTDPQPGSWLHSSLKRDVIEMGRRQRATWAKWDAKLAENQRKIDDLLARERDAARERIAAEVVADPPDAVEPIEGLVPPPDPVAEDIDALAASAAIGSPAHLAWRTARIPNSNPFQL